MRLTKKHLTGIVVGAVAIGVLGMYLFCAPLMEELRKQRLTSEIAVAEVAEARAYIAALGTEHEGKAFIKEGDVPLAIDELTKQGKLAGVNFVSITPGEMRESEDPRYGTLPIEMEMEFKYEQLGAFLGSLDELKKSFVTVEHFRVVPDENNTSQLRTNLIVYMYVSGKDHAE